MSRLKCPRCGFVSWVDATACKRCGAAVHTVGGARTAAGAQFYGNSRPPQKPGWVELGLFGIKTRGGALAWLVAGVVLPLGVSFGLFYVMTAFAAADASFALVVALLGGVTGLLAPLWYWLSIRWMDEHDAWPGRR